MTADITFSNGYTFVARRQRKRNPKAGALAGNKPDTAMEPAIKRTAYKIANSHTRKRKPLIFFGCIMVVLIVAGIPGCTLKNLWEAKFNPKLPPAADFCKEMD